MPEPVKPAVRLLTVLDETVTVHYETGLARVVAQPKLAALVVRLILAPDMRVSVAELNGEMWPGKGSNGLPQAVTQLRRFLDVQRGRSAYQLVLAREQVDALCFVDCVRRLPDSPAPADIDPLLELWRFDPRRIHAVHKELWDPVSDAVKTLVGHVVAQGFDADGLIHLARFREVMRHEPVVRVMRGSERTRPRLLIVEDDVSAAFDIHLGDYEFQPIVKTIKEFWDLTEKNPTLEGYDCALVDQHLTASMNDYGGTAVCEYLRDNTAVPAILMSVAKLPAKGNHDEMKRRLRLVGLYTKADDGTLDGLRDMISAALDGRPA